MHMQKRTRVVIYIRVSTDKQADFGIGLDVQRERCLGYAKLYDLSVVSVVEDPGASAKTLDRSGLKRALDMLRKGEADAILVAKLDRLTRSVVNLGELVEEYFTEGRWNLLSVGEQIDTRTATGRLVLNILASVSQWEREAIGERTAAAMRHKASLGEYTGGEVPYGFRLGPEESVGRDREGRERVIRRLVKDDHEALVVELVQALHENGESLHGIARALGARGARARSGRSFGAEQIKRMLQLPNPAESLTVSAA